MDRISREQRSWNMSRIRSRDTQPEKAVKKVLLLKNIKFRLHAKKLPGKPDIVISEDKKIIFINGCFWHQHKGCKRRAMPKTNTKYWKLKLLRNVSKQKEDISALKKLGWKTYIIWECQTKNQSKLNRKLQKALT